MSNESCTLGLELDSLAEVLQQRGYTTGAFSCNPLISVERSFDQGFESFDHDRQDFRMTDEVAGDIVEWLRAHRGVRFFLYLHLADPHTPHRPHREEVERLGFVAPDDFPTSREVMGQTVPSDGMDVYNDLLIRSGADYQEVVPPAHQRWIEERYDASVATGDRWLGHIFAELEALGLTETTVIAFTSDHGEELFEHGQLEHGHTVHREVTHVPLILAGPGLPAGRRVPGVVSNRHVAPTLARFGGARLPAAEAFDALFLLDVPAGPVEDAAGSAVYQTLKGNWGSERKQDLYGIREGDWVLHWRKDEELGPEDTRLYDLSLDPGETTDLSAPSRSSAHAAPAGAGAAHPGPAGLVARASHRCWGVDTERV